MNSRKLIIILSCVILVALLLTGLASAKTTRTYFTGTEEQKSTEAPLKEWPAGQSYHIRGMHSTYEEVASDPRASGINNTLTNINFHPPAADGKIGQFWGTFVNTNEDLDGQWIGTFEGQIYFDGSSQLDAQGKGAGSFAGLKIHLHSEGDGVSPSTFEGYILDPGG